MGAFCFHKKMPGAALVTPRGFRAKKGYNSILPQITRIVTNIMSQFSKSQIEIIVYRKLSNVAFWRALVATGRERAVRVLVAQIAEAAANEISNLDIDYRASRPARALYVAGIDAQNGAGVALAETAATEQEQQ